MKKLPKIYQGDFTKEIHNNKEVDYVSNESIDNKETVMEVINKIFSGTRHSFNISVLIKTKDKVYDTKIASKVNNYIITLDNDIIFIKDIISIDEK